MAELLQGAQINRGSGVIGLLTRGSAIKKANEQLKHEQQQQQRRQQLEVQNLMAGSGIDFSQVGEERTEAIRGLLGDPDTRAQGLAQQQSIADRQGFDRTLGERVSDAQAQQNLFEQTSPAAQRQVQRASEQADLELQLKQLEFDQAQGMGLSPERLVSVSGQLRKERRQDLDPYMNSLRSFDELSNTLQFDSGPASMAALFKFISALDDSVVRESEGNLLTTSTGPVRQLANLFNQVGGGGLFDEQTKQEILQVATGVAQTQFQAANEINKRHDILAGRFAERFMAPALVSLSQAAQFDRGRTFEAIETQPRRRTKRKPTTAELTDHTGKVFEAVN